MKKFWKDYWELFKASGRFCKDHWKGVILLNAVLIGTELAYYQARYDLFDLDFSKKSEKEEEAQE